MPTDRTRQPRSNETSRSNGPGERKALTLETLARPGWRTSSTNCFRERRRLVMNLRVRSVTAGAAFVSAMLDAACLPTCGARGRLRRSWLAGALGGGGGGEAGRGRRGSNIYLLKP
jgi:hypothetical protein